MAFDSSSSSPLPLEGGEAGSGGGVRKFDAATAGAGKPLNTPIPNPSPLQGEGGSHLRNAAPQTILREALERHAGRIALVSSFGAESAVLLHMLSEIDRSVPVLFLDTGLLFAQTLDYRKQLAERLGLSDVRDLRPAFRDLATIDPGGVLWKTDTDACCTLRKVVPLDRALEGFDAWITGRKRFQSASRAQLPVIEASGSKTKINPLANWTQHDLEAYAQRHDLPQHPLVRFGYPSIGCWPCTRPVDAGEDQRSGRWADSEKVECGIHTPRPADLTAINAPFEAIGEGL